MQLRPFQKKDTDTLVKIYRDSIRRIGPDFYTASQIEAWSIYPVDIDDFAYRLSRGYTLVAEEDDQIRAFGQIDPLDFVSFIYTAADACRKGFATRVCDAMETHARAHGVTAIRTEASLISKGFFLKRGYHVVTPLHLTHFGVEFDWYCMAKPLAEPPPIPNAA